VENGGNSPVGHVANGRNPFGPEDGDNKAKMKGKANISLPMAFYELLLRDSVTRFFASGSFHEPVSPQPQSIPLGPLQILTSASQGAPLVSTTLVANNGNNIRLLRS
jgi:hypothetical protein